MIDIEILKQDILARPELNGPRLAGDCVGIADFYNKKRVGVDGTNYKVPINSVLKWAARGPFAKISDTAEDKALPIAVRSICMAASRLFQTSTEVDLQDSDIQDMIQALRAANVLTNDEVQKFLKLADIKTISYGEKLFGKDALVSIIDVTISLERINA